MNLSKINEWIFSKKNLAGCVCATFGLILYLVGFIDVFWWLIAGGFYLLGYFVVPEPKTVSFYHLDNESLQDYKGFFERLMKGGQQFLPDEAIEKLMSIKQTSFELIDFMEKNKESSGGYDENIMAMKMIFEKYMPNLINKYIKLPKRYAETIKTRDNQTSKDLLLEQLVLLDQQMTKIAHATYENDIKALQIHGNFLKEKFEEKSLFEIEK